MFKVTVPEIKVVFFKVKWSTTLIPTMGWRGVEGGEGGWRGGRVYITRGLAAAK